MAQKVSYSKKVTEAYNTLSSFIVRGGKGMPPHWPFSIIETNWYYSRFLPKELLQLFKKLAKKGIPIDEMAKLFWGPSVPSHWFYIADFPFKGLTTKQSEAFIEKTIELISNQRRNDIFCRDGKNILLKPNEIKKIYDVASFIPVSGNLVSKIGEFNITMWHYCILIQVGHRSYSQEFHGPYELKSGETVFVRDFFNLSPVEVWGFATLPFKRLRSIEIYKKNVGLRIDMLNHYSSRLFLPKNRAKVALSVDGNFVRGKRELLSIFRECQDALKKGNKAVEGFSKQDWVKRIIGMRFLWLKTARELVGEDWRPPNSLYDLADRTREAERQSIHWVKNMQATVINLPPGEAIGGITQLFLNNIYQREDKH